MSGTRARGSMERLNNMLGIAKAKRSDFREEPVRKLDNDTMCDMIEARLGTMIARHAELQTKLEEIEERIRAFAASHSLSYDRISWSHPAYFPKDRPEVQFLGTVADHVLGEHHEPYTTGGGTYARCAENIIAFGALFPGDEDRMHQKDERLSLDRLKDATKIYADVIARLGKKDFPVPGRE